MPVAADTPSFGGLVSSYQIMQNGFPRSGGSLIVTEIKEKAKENVLKETRGASALSLIKIARNQSLMAREYESKGDLKGALGAFTKAASLAQMCSQSNEFITEGRGARGLLHKEFMEFMEQFGRDLTDQTPVLESKLAEIERAGHITNGTVTDDGPVRKTGGLIADRVRQLKDNGMTVSTTKRFPIPTPPVSPKAIQFSRSSGQSISSPPLAPSSLTPVTPISSASSPHAFVSPSTLGPPSPSSSSSSSPRLPNINLSEFAQAFPSIDELDDLHGLQLHSVSGGTVSDESKVSLPEFHGGESSQPASIRSFPVLSVDPGPRPSSTPITPTISTFASQPSSPAHSPIKSSNLSFSNKTPAPPKSPLPVSNIVSPKDLYEYMNQIGLKVLLLDIRTRSEFEKEHIRGDAVVCLEPSVLLRENVNDRMLEDSLTVGPRLEWTLFCNRDKFDLVTIYDHSSTSPGPASSPLSTLTRAIYEQSFRRLLKNMPMLLVGGLLAWKQEVGEDEVIRGQSESFLPEVQQLPVVAQSPMLASVNTMAPARDPHELWTPRSRADTTSTLSDNEYLSKGEERPPYLQDQSNGISRSTAEADYTNAHQSSESKRLIRRPAFMRPSTSVSIPSSYARNKSENMPSPTIPQSMTNGSASIQYPSFAGKSSVPPSSFTSSGNFALVSPPPTASLNHSLTRRRSDYIDQSQEALSGFNTRPSIDYPELSSKHILRPPPAAASYALERHDNRPRLAHGPSFSNTQLGPKPPKISSDWPVTYWPDIQIAISGLKNLGNTCYMNSPIQCLSATVPFSRFFTDGRWKSGVNCVNPLGTKGKLASAFAKLLLDMWHGEHSYIAPYEFRASICTHAERFRGSDQHDSQEFLSFLLDGLHEDLNRVLNKPVWVTSPEREAELERLPQQVASEQEWRAWRDRNDSVIVDFFQGQFRNRLECMTCHKTSTTYDPFTSLALPVPTSRGSGKVSLKQCLDAFVKPEVMEKNNAWRCPHCKELRKTTKQLSFSRLPPVLIIHLKRFSFEGRWTDKIDTFVDFPLKSLDLTNYMPPPLPPGAENTQLNGITLEDPRSQMPPYRYDLYGVTNHFGSLSSGHYTAFISSRGGWVYCDDSSVKPTDAREVVGKPAYILFYKRTKV